MIIHQPEITYKDGEVCVSTRVEMSQPLQDLPERLWFKFPEKYTAAITDRSDGFAASLLLLAMHCGEAMEVRGAISPRLAYGLQEWQRIFHYKLPGKLKLAELKFHQLQSLTKDDVQGKVGTAFSGGVDSLFTLWSHLQENQPIPPFRLTHGLFVHGFDIRLYEEETYQRIFQLYDRSFRQLGLELIGARTNAYQFSRFRVKWGLFHGGPLLGAALVLGKFFERFYIPGCDSSLMLEQLYGTSPVTDYLLSTETVEFIHFTGGLSRMEKLAVLAKWPPAYELLRVCNDCSQATETINCSRCEKCRRTMTLLEVLGELPKFQTFNKPFRYQDFLQWGFFQHPHPCYPKMIIGRTLHNKRLSYAIPMLLATITSTLWFHLYPKIYNLIPQKWIYPIKKRLYPGLIENDDD